MIDRHRRAPLLISILAVLSLPAFAAASMMLACNDPCLAAARGTYRQCVSSASGAFQDAVDGCLERDHECVDACRSQREDCRDGTGSAAALAACDDELETTKQECRDRFPLTPKESRHRRGKCIDKAQVAEFHCSNEVHRRFRQALRDCRQAFRQCTDECGPGGPPGGTAECRAQGKAAHRAVRADCKLTFQVTSSGCINKDVTCVQGCGDARVTCEAPTRSMLGAAITACTVDEAAAVAACRAANPAGSTGLDSCITAAQANAAVCRDAAVDAAAPGLAACVQPYVACVRACPPS